MVNETKLIRRRKPEPPVAEPQDGWCGRTAGVTLPPTRFALLLRVAHESLSARNGIKPGLLLSLQVIRAQGVSAESL